MRRSSRTIQALSKQKKKDHGRSDSTPCPSTGTLDNGGETFCKWQENHGGKHEDLLGNKW